MSRVERLLQWVRECDECHGLLFDIDGTLVRGGTVLHGATQLFAYLDSRSLPYLLVTNDSNHSHAEKASFLCSVGLDIGPAAIVSAGDVLTRLVSERRLARRAFFVMGDLGRPDYAEEAGLVVIRDLGLLEGAAGVIVGEENHDWESTFNAVVNYFIDHPNAPLLVPNPDIYWPAGVDKISIGAGGKAKFICSVLEEYGISVQPEYLGKPYGAVFEHARAKIDELRGQKGGPADRIVMVGDSLKSDIRGANRAGFLSVLVLTGITSEEQVEELPGESELRPDVIVDGL